MDLLDYLMLSEERQWDTLHEVGIELVEASSIEYDYLLYGLHGFFVEVVFDKVLGTALFKNEFIDGIKLDKYLPSVTL